MYRTEHDNRSSAKDRFTVDFESIGFFTKQPKYKFNQVLEPLAKSTVTDPDHPTAEGMRNARTTWDFAFEPSSNEHYAAYPSKLVERMVLASTDAGDLVYDPFGGTATTALTAHRLGRNWICSELQPKYVELSNRRLEAYLAQKSLFT